MLDPFAAPEGLSNVPHGLWPSPYDQTLDCGHAVAEDDLIGRVGDGIECDDCVVAFWDSCPGGHSGPF